MNTEVTNAPLVLPERLSAVEVGRGVSFQLDPSLEKKSTAIQRGGSLLLSAGGSILVSANALKVIRPRRESNAGWTSELVRTNQSSLESE